MKKYAYWGILVIVIGALLLAACGGGASEGETPGDESGGGTGTLDRPEPPQEYAGMTNPLSGDAAAADAGQQIYQTNCASCHGESGQGDGPAAASLDPHPQNLAENVGQLSDAYLYWRISEGGAMDPFNSAMPAWKGVLSEDQIWQVITYLHTF